MSEKEKAAEAPKPKCGIIMPISASEGYSEEHWQDVLQVIQDAAGSVGFEANLVSANGKADIIHSTIINNIFHNEIVVCDVSDMNPNVMIELGLRFAAKKPVIIIFDSEKKYPFDIGQLRYYNYGRNLRYSALVKFKIELSELIDSVYKDDIAGKYRPYLSHFTEVTINPATIPTEQVSVVQALEELRNEVVRIKSFQTFYDSDYTHPSNLLRVLGSTPSSKINKASIFEKVELNLLQKSIFKAINDVNDPNGFKDYLYKHKENDIEAQLLLVHTAIIPYIKENDPGPILAEGIRLYDNMSAQKQKGFVKIVINNYYAQEI
ncbi:hypothetical protein [Hymenobacter sp. YC55]|uniref:hypothetical protein n=1 Tax=Hymenobacter sp. YC55 TaxID=3034019 RepID=UPI0023F85B8A|nr:hypothetical protein [Hymenobacter sp. YC55]MDF7813640.1 hypothetical protein [Hymenobacter sp. YC55]